MFVSKVVYVCARKHDSLFEVVLVVPKSKKYQGPSFFKNTSLYWRKSDTIPPFVFLKIIIDDV